MDETAEAYRRIAQLQGVAVSAARIGSVAQTLARLLDAEQAATRGLDFETEPSAFVATLARGAQ
ncbi:MAG: hypothetical protein AB1773_07160 [Pseudomonadota bacterium]|jgi:hypothetical protein